MLRDCYSACRGALQNGGVEAPGFEALCLLEHVTGYDRAGLLAHGGDSVPAEQEERLRALTEKRLTRYPLQYLLGEWSFMGFPLSVGEGVLIPRDDTEVCARLCLDYLKDKPGAAAADLCAGSGAIAVALEKIGHASVTAVELSERAYAFLLKNIERNQCHIRAVRGDVFTCHGQFPDGSLDLIVSNPPYIPRGELAGLQAEVQYEPREALDGGADGCVFYEAITRLWSRKLKPGGALVFELGEGQAAYVSGWMRRQGFDRIRTEQDLGGCERAVIGVKRSDG